MSEEDTFYEVEEPPQFPPDWVFEPTVADEAEFYGTFGEGWKPEQDLEIVF
jgi:hypothetical protein